ncbi:Parp11 [Symbiodinium natans]|uniref:Parp11 protein n=1 Tax=Symbiodinium natans TaxID=878477 RepID=A0A812MR75_9DINO|nr:Parp11 [Symbiodinium natans]
MVILRGVAEASGNCLGNHTDAYRCSPYKYCQNQASATRRGPETLASCMAACDASIECTAIQYDCGTDCLLMEAAACGDEITTSCGSSLYYKELGSATSTTQVPTSSTTLPGQASGNCLGINTDAYRCSPYKYCLNQVLDPEAKAGETKKGKCNQAWPRNPRVMHGCLRCQHRMHRYPVRLRYRLLVDGGCCLRRRDSHHLWQQLILQGAGERHKHDRTGSERHNATRPGVERRQWARSSVKGEPCALRLSRHFHASLSSHQVFSGKPHRLTVVRFETERLFDVLRVNSVDYSGLLPPGLSGAVVHGTISWSSDTQPQIVNLALICRSDGSNSKYGWKICLQEVTPGIWSEQKQNVNNDTLGNDSSWPGAMGVHVAAYDNDSQVLWLHGGLDLSGSLDRLWKYDVQAGTWDQPALITNGSNESQPSARGYHDLGDFWRYDIQAQLPPVEEASQDVKAASWQEQTLLNETAGANLSNASGLSGPSGPSARVLHVMVYDGYRYLDDLWQYDVEGLLLDDLWMFDVQALGLAGNWSEKAAVHKPAPRHLHVLVYDSDSQAMT